MALLSEHLVGRAEELGAFNQLLAGLDSGEGAAVALVGEPGIGKTRLLAELAARSDARGHLVLSGSASELERDLPFWVFVDALEEYIQALDPRVFASLDEDVRTELGRVFPSLSALASGRPAGISRALPEPPRGVRPARTACEDHPGSARARRPALGGYGFHRTAGRIATPTALAGADGSGHASTPAAGAIVGGARERLSRRCAASESSFARSAARSRVNSSARPSMDRRPPLSTRRAAAIRSTSSTSPARCLKRRRPAPRVESPGSATSTSRPRSRPRWRRSSALLSEGARLVLEGAAVAGDPFEPELAAAAASTPEACAIEALDELLQLGLVRETYVPRRFRFRHPLVRRAVYESTPAGWRLGAHERTARALEDRGAPASGSSAPRRALGTAGRSVRHRDVALGRRSDGASSTGQRGTVVRRRSQPPARRHRGRGASRAPAGAGGIARGDRPILREPCRADRVPRARARQSDRAARAPDHGLRRGRALARPSPRSAPRLLDALDDLEDDAPPKASR